jgi:hypothetical protein
LWIAERQGQRHSYCGLFAPTDADMAGPVTLFTGEKLTTRAGRIHVLGQEAYRALLLLNSSDKAVAQAVQSACGKMQARLDDARRAACDEHRGRYGEYCCGTCSVSVWRSLLAGAYPALDAERWLAAGIKSLRANRTDKGDWRRYPLWYTLLALAEMSHLPGAKQEIQYVASRATKSATRSLAEPYATRRREILQRVLQIA